MNKEERSEGTTSAFWYVIAGALVGTAAGLLLAPKSGEEMREDIADWSRRGRERARDVFTRVGASIPARVKAGAAFGALRGGAKSAASAAADKIDDIVS